MKRSVTVEELWERLTSSEIESLEYQRLRGINNEFRSLNESPTLEPQRHGVESTVTTNENAITDIENQATTVTTTLSEAATEISNVSSYWPMVGVLGIMALTAAAFIYINRNNSVGNNTVTYSILGYQVFEKKSS